MGFYYWSKFRKLQSAMDNYFPYMIGKSLHERQQKKVQKYYHKKAQYELVYKRFFPITTVSLFMSRDHSRCYEKRKFIPFQFYVMREARNYLSLSFFFRYSSFPAIKHNEASHRNQIDIIHNF